jgi:hypothetical protein
VHNAKMRATKSFMVVVGAVALGGGCNRRDDRDAAVSKPVAAAARDAAAPVDGERPLARRREAQPALDSARADLARGEFDLAAPPLRHAAAFFRMHATSPRGSGSSAMLVSATSLDDLARDLEGGKTTTIGRLDTLSARANLAEAEYHRSLAAVAWTTQAKESVADELVMAADHFERAAHDAGLPITSTQRELLREVRHVAAELSARPAPALTDFDEPIAALGSEIARLGRVLDRS